VPHVRLGVRGPKKMGEAHNCFCSIKPEIRCSHGETHSKHIIIDPRTLGRTWGTRPVLLLDKSRYDTDSKGTVALTVIKILRPCRAKAKEAR
jgi:hypothetical protein